jgi:hypothetical protein
MVRVLVSMMTLLILLSDGRARADWINMTGAETAPNIAEIHIGTDRLRLLLEIFIEDLEVFRDLVPDDLLADAGPNRPSTEQRLRRFSEETFRVVTEDGKPLGAELKLVEPRLRQDRYAPFAGAINPFTGRKVSEAPADKRVLYAEIDYLFDKRPETLTLIPPSDADGMPRVTIGFIAYHSSVPVIDFRYLTGPATVSLNWEDPWYSKFDNAKLTRHHKSGLMSFLYVQPHEVRHEVLARVKDLEPWIDLGLRNENFVEPDEWPGLKARVGDFLLTRNTRRTAATGDANGDPGPDHDLPHRRHPGHGQRRLGPFHRQDPAGARYRHRSRGTLSILRRAGGPGHQMGEFPE